MHINNWYAACEVKDITDGPLRVKILGCHLALYRDGQDQIHCVSDLCVHRGASLSQGKLKDDNLQCPQHGWRFNGAGQCTLIPAGTSNGTTPPKRARIPSYPVQEKYGLVFVFLGDLDEHERPQIPDIYPEYDDTQTYHSTCITKQPQVNYIRMSENYNDPAHVNFIHEFAAYLPLGVTIIPKINDALYLKAFHASHDEDGNHSEDMGLMMEYSVVGNMSKNTQTIPGVPLQIVTAVVTPIDHRNSAIFMITSHLKSQVSHEDHLELVQMTKDIVMDEDDVVLTRAEPFLPAPVSEELLVEADRTLVDVRNMNAAFSEKYGAVDHTALAALADSHIRVIPCPDHKADPKNWVHKIVPLVGAS